MADNEAMRTTPSFGRAGRPRKISFSDLFLWDPIVDLEFRVSSLSEVIGEDCPEMVAILRDLGRKRAISVDRARAVLPRFLSDLGVPLADELERGLDGNEGAFSHFGPWQIYIYGHSYKKDGPWPPKVSVLGQHIIDIERELKAPTEAWRQNNPPRCADLLEASPVLKDYLWPAILSNLREASTEEEGTTARVLVLLEFWISFLACEDAQIQAQGMSQAPSFEELFPDFSAETIKSPNALFFDWLQGHIGTQVKLVEQIPQISVAASQEPDPDSQRRQLRRWKRGRGFPSEDVLNGLFWNLYGYGSHKAEDPRHRDWNISWRMALAAKRIAFLMTILNVLSELEEPVAPFGYASIQEWRVNRYRHWYRHWLPLQAEQR